ncbi:histidine kinase dimerization/phospho-acceptor domain-containing protein [Candidatus Electronema sp. JM]|uniref:histidine kinase dimerization/phospho-acceptor domain-containing protein n=1 Tax=Candidatus Electronema sp. JM TaxID=3401571 RepID=UPI003AA863BD
MSGDSPIMPVSPANWQHLLLIFDALGSYALVLDRHGIVLAANRIFLDTVGLGRDEVAGMSPDKLESHLSGLKEQLAELGGGAARTFNTRLTDRRSKVFIAEMSLIRLEEEQGGGLLCTGRSLHRLTGCQEAALRRTEQQLIAANRLKRKFIANINHAIRTPMNAIIGYAEILAESGLTEQQQRFVSTIRKNGTALVSIINDVMELSKLESGSVKVLKSAANLRAVVEQAADLFTDQIRAKKLEFLWTVERDLPEMYLMDADHCRQVLINLISNAVKFTERGRIVLNVSGAEAAPGCWELFFRLEDSGIGLSVDEQLSLRELFEQQLEQVSIRDGTRLGLTLCARLTQMMGGGIQFESVQGQGSVFIFTMPVQAVDKPAGPSCVRVPQEKKSDPVLLVIDDMPEMSNLIKIYFANSSVRVLEASGPEDGFALAVAEQPDLILMDLDLAGADGRDLASRIRQEERTAHLPIVAMTGFMLDKEGLQPLFDDFLPKPFHLQELQILVARHIHIDRGGNDSPHWATPKSVPDLSRIRTVWSSELENAYRQAEMSGNLEDACALGRKMEECGQQTKTEALTAMGRDLQHCAQDLDIRGVEQVLTALRKAAEVEE